MQCIGAGWLTEEHCFNEVDDTGLCLRTKGSRLHHLHFYVLLENCSGRDIAIFAADERLHMSCTRRDFMVCTNALLGSFLGIGYQASASAYYREQHTVSDQSTRMVSLILYKLDDD